MISCLMQREVLQGKVHMAVQATDYTRDTLALHRTSEMSRLITEA
jgi:hypothetical protein